MVLWLILLCKDLGQVWFGCSYSVAQQWEQFVKHKTKVCLKDKEIITISAWAHDITPLLSIWESTMLTAAQSTFTAGINKRTVWMKTLSGDLRNWRMAAQVIQSLWNWEENQIEKTMLNCVVPFSLTHKHTDRHRHTDTHTHTHTHPCWTQAPLFQQHFCPSTDINQQAWFPETENPSAKEKPATPAWVRAEPGQEWKLRPSGRDIIQ